jgi:hypothetical protein
MERSPWITAFVSLSRELPLMDRRKRDWRSDRVPDN